MFEQKKYLYEMFRDSHYRAWDILHIIMNDGCESVFYDDAAAFMHAAPFISGSLKWNPLDLLENIS